jgi:DNA-directed RNA polymerase specialized sigma24 family protein
LSLGFRILPDHPRKEQAVEKPNSLEKALAKIDPESRGVIEVWLEGLSHSEAAEVLGLSERAFAVVRVNAIERLRRLLGQETESWETNLSRRLCGPVA